MAWRIKAKGADLDVYISLVITVVVASFLLGINFSPYFFILLLAIIPISVRFSR